MISTSLSAHYVQAKKRSKSITLFCHNKLIDNKLTLNNQFILLYYSALKIS
jgi:hypothetical protein